VSKNKLIVQEMVVSLTRINDSDFISLTDIARVKNPTEPKDVVKNWLRSRSTIEFLGLWERINNPDFKGVEFDPLKNAAGSNSFTLSPNKWIETTGAIGIKSTSGRNGGTFAHKDIAFEFASWISAEFKLFLIKEFQRLKDEEIANRSLEWNLIPASITTAQAGLIYASEAEVLNMALFSITSRQWREENPAKEGNMRDHAAIEQLVVLSNLESINAEWIRQQFDLKNNGSWRSTQPQSHRCAHCFRARPSKNSNEQQHMTHTPPTNCYPLTPIH
jgi:KilA-N domain